MTFKHTDLRVSRHLNDLARQQDSIRKVRLPTAPTADAAAMSLVRGDLDILEWSRMHPHFKDITMRAAAKIDPSSSLFEAKIAASLARAELRLDGLLRRCTKAIAEAAPRQNPAPDHGFDTLAFLDPSLDPRNRIPLTPPL